MISHADLDDRTLHAFMRTGRITMAGNLKLKIYGTLKCHSGKRMTRATRVFFTSAHEAVNNAYRPCGHCMKTEYKVWKDSNTA